MTPRESRRRPQRRRRKKQPRSAPTSWSAEAEVDVVAAVLIDRGFPLTSEEARDIAGEQVRALKEYERSVVRTWACGAPTNDGWPCQQPRQPGNVGCMFHPNWRSSDEQA